MRVFEHCEACTAPCGGGTVTSSMRRVANATLLRFGRYDEPLRTRAYSHPIHVYNTVYSTLTLASYHSIHLWCTPRMLTRERITHVYSRVFSASFRSHRSQHQIPHKIPQTPAPDPAVITCMDPGSQMRSHANVCTRRSRVCESCQHAHSWQAEG